MEKNQRVMGKRAGFTIVELLTVMAVIAILIGLLVPALNLVHDTAKDVQQRAQFHGIEIGLEMFKSEFGVYPESIDSQDEFAADGTTALKPYSGANKLAEAMVGWDLLGFHPKAEFTSEGVDLTGVKVYDTSSANRDVRSDHYVGLEKANAFRMDDIYSDPAPLDDGGVSPYYVLCDSYAKRRAVSGYKTGTPILYFKANTKYDTQVSATTAIIDDTGDDVYNYYDNLNILALGSAEDGEDHLISDAVGNDLIDFDKIIVNEQIFASTAGVGESIGDGGIGTQVPYCSKSYILMSAGKDGLFGNSDDIYNFEKDK